jgi:hypothetical protein
VTVGGNVPPTTKKRRGDGIDYEARARKLPSNKQRFTVAAAVETTSYTNKLCTVQHQPIAQRRRRRRLSLVFALFFCVFFLEGEERMGGYWKGIKVDSFRDTF